MPVTIQELKDAIAGASQSDRDDLADVFIPGTAAVIASKALKDLQDLAAAKFAFVQQLLSVTKNNLIKDPKSPIPSEKELNAAFDQTP